MISSKSNQRIKRIHKLLNKGKSRREERCFVVEGIKVVREALRQGLAEEIYVSEEFQVEDGIPLTYTISASVFREISDTVTPQGVMAVVRMPEYDSEDIFLRDRCRLLCLEGVRDPGNVGTMIRTAEAAGMDAVLLSADCADVFQPKVVRSTMGAILRVPCLIADMLSGMRSSGGAGCDISDHTGKHEKVGDVRGSDFPEVMEALQAKGFTLYAAHLQGAVDYREPSYEGRIGILIGNEAKGLSDEVTALSDVRVKIPMQGEVESLNAAVSAALLMYETI